MPRLKKTYNEQMQDLVAEYIAAGHMWPASSSDIARWAIKHGKWSRSGAAMQRLCAREISRALREEMHEDPQGRRVRTKHAAKYSHPNPDGSIDQHTLWADIRSATRDHMEVAFKQRRRQIVQDCTQLSTDVESYNENGPKGPPIKMLWDFTNDVKEAALPTEYQPSDVDPAIADIIKAPGLSQAIVQKPIPTRGPGIPSSPAVQRTYPN